MTKQPYCWDHSSGFLGKRKRYRIVGDVVEVCMEDALGRESWQPIDPDEEPHVFESLIVEYARVREELEQLGRKSPRCAKCRCELADDPGSLRCFECQGDVESGEAKWPAHEVKRKLDQLRKELTEVQAQVGELQELAERAESASQNFAAAAEKAQEAAEAYRQETRRLRDVLAQIQSLQVTFGEKPNFKALDSKFTTAVTLASEALQIAEPCVQLPPSSNEK